VWATPMQALLVAERCAALSGHDTDFVMIITEAYTGMRWSEVIGPAAVTAVLSGYGSRVILPGWGVGRCGRGFAVSCRR
jgi:hypothetical protein